jgi:hypothetical protein
MVELVDLHETVCPTEHLLLAYAPLNAIKLLPHPESNRAGGMPNEWHTFTYTFLPAPAPWT